MFAGLVESPIMFTESIPVKNKLVKRKTIRVPKHKCSVCGKTFLAKRQYQDHMNTHSGIRAHPCDICEQSFYSLPNLIAHKAIHSTVRPYTCTSCGSGFNQKNDLFVHLVTLICTRAGKHVSEALDGTWFCVTCNKTFRSKEVGYRHARTHETGKGLPCPVCPENFRGQKHNIIVKHCRNEHPDYFKTLITMIERKHIQCNI